MRLLPLLVFLSCAGAGAVVLEACSSDSPSGTGTELDAGGGADTGPGEDPDGAAPEDGATTKDADPEKDACAVSPPSLDAGGGCGTMEFGVIAAPFGPVDGGSNTYAGGALPAGIYDAVGAERASGSKGSWRETLVVDGAGRYTRIRQIDTGLSDASLGPVTRRSGSYTTSGTNITMTPDCAQSDGTFVDAGSDTLPYEAVTDSTCGATYRYGVTGIRITLKRR
jgi:hypothetical protein